MDEELKSLEREASKFVRDMEQLEQDKLLTEAINARNEEKEILMRKYKGFEDQKASFNKIIDRLNVKIEFLYNIMDSYGPDAWDE